MSVQVRVATAAELAACQAVRHEVFVLGQGVPASLEQDGLDATSTHILALAANNKVLGTARLRVDDQVAICQRVAVRAATRGLGLGRRLMDAFEQEAQARGCLEVRLHAQASVVGFYERLGYHAHGDAFWEAGIEHRHMSKVL